MSELYIRNVGNASEDTIRERFGTYGVVMKNGIKIMHDVCNIRFISRDSARSAMDALQGRLHCGAQLRIGFAPSEATRTNRLEILRSQYQKLLGEQLQVFVPALRIRIKNVPLKGDSAIKDELLKVTGKQLSIILN